MTSPLPPHSARKKISTPLHPISAMTSDTSPYPTRVSARSLITGPGCNASSPPPVMTATLLSQKKVGLFSSPSLIAANSVFLFNVHIIWTRFLLASAFRAFTRRRYCAWCRHSVFLVPPHEPPFRFLTIPVCIVPPVSHLLRIPASWFQIAGRR
jgi:hypothetical protein